VRIVQIARYPHRVAKAARPQLERSTARNDHQPRESRSRLLSHAAIAAGLCTLVIAAYSNSFSAGFALDSQQLVLNDPRVHAVTAENVGLVINRTYWWPYGESGLYRPLTTLSFLLNYAALGSAERPAGYHWFNLVIHILNVWLVWWLARQITGQRAAAIAAAAIWSVLPLSTEAVTNIVGRADLLAALGVLGGLASYVRARATTGTLRMAWLAGLMLMTTIGVFAKENGVAIVGVIALYEIVWWDRRISIPALMRGAVAIGLPTAMMLLQRTAVLTAAGIAEFPYTDNPIGGAGFWLGRLTAVQVIWRYVFLLFWPATLSIDYSYNQIPIATGTAGDWLAVAALVAIVAAAIRFRHFNRAAFFFAAFSAIVFLPASNLVVTSGTIMAERLAYLPSAGLVISLSLALFARASSPRSRLTAIVVAMVIVVAGGARTWMRNKDWKDDVTIWSAAVAASPASAKTHRGFAEALSHADPAGVNFDRVIAEGEESVRLLEPLPAALSSFPSFRQAAAAHLDRAEAIRHQSAPSAPLAPEVRRSYERAIDLLRMALAIALTSNTPTSAISIGQQADTRRMNAAAYTGLGESARAIDEAQRARQLDPLHPRAHRLLASAYISGGDREQAAIALMVGAMLTSDPGDGRALIDVYRVHYSGGCALSSTPTGLVLNPACPTVREHVCAASPPVIALHLQIGRPAQAEVVRRTAMTQWRCDIATP
jgi:protein O-mannosyl-transferase